MICSGSGSWIIIPSESLADNSTFSSKSFWEVALFNLIQLNSTPSSIAFSSFLETYNNDAGLSPTVIAVSLGFISLAFSKFVKINLLLASSSSAIGFPYSILSI